MNNQNALYEILKEVIEEKEIGFSSFSSLPSSIWLSFALEAAGTRSSSLLLQWSLGTDTGGGPSAMSRVCF